MRCRVTPSSPSSACSLRHSKGVVVNVASIRTACGNHENNPVSLDTRRCTRTHAAFCCSFISFDVAVWYWSPRFFEIDSQFSNFGVPHVPARIQSNERGDNPPAYFFRPANIKETIAPTWAVTNELNFTVWMAQSFSFITNCVSFLQLKRRAYYFANRKRLTWAGGLEAGLTKFSRNPTG